MQIIVMQQQQMFAFFILEQRWEWIHANPECRFSKNTAAFTLNSCCALHVDHPHYLSPLLFLRLFAVLFSFSAKPSADLELVGLSLSLTTHAGLSDRLSKIPLGSAWSKIGPVYLSVESKVRARQMNKRVTQNEIGLNVSRNCVLDPENRIIKVPIWQ